VPVSGVRTPFTGPNRIAREAPSLPTAYAYRSTSSTAGCSATAPIFPISIGELPATSIAFSKGEARPELPVQSPTKYDL